MYAEELLKKLSEPADLAIALLGFGFGFLLSVLHLSGDPPAGTIAGLGAIVFVGLKKARDVYLQRRRQERRIKSHLKRMTQYYIDNPKVLASIRYFEHILSSRVIDLEILEHMIHQHVIGNIERSLEESVLSSKYDDLKDSYEQLMSDSERKFRELLADFDGLHAVAESPDKNRDELVRIWESLDEKYFCRGIKARKKKEEEKERAEDEAMVRAVHRHIAHVG